jgi:outer membrane protein TolC
MEVGNEITGGKRMFARVGRSFMTVIASIMLFACVWGNALGQEASVRTLTLQESIDIAMTENLSMKTAEEKVETAKQKVNEARAAFMPVVSASGSYTYFGELPTMEFDFDASMLGLSPELMQMMGGGQDQPQAQEQESEPPEIPMGEEDTYQVGVSIQQPIFTWGKIYNNYKQSRLSLEASKQEFEATRQQVVLDVTTAFYGVLLTEKLVKVTEMAVSQVEAHVKIAQDLVDAGVATNFDLLRAKVQLANINSQLIRIRNALKLSKNGLKNAIGMDLDAQIGVGGELTYHPLDLNLAELLESAMADRPELKQLQLQELIGEKFVSLAKAGNKPSLALVGNYDYQSNAETPGDIFDGDEWKNTWNITLALQIPIFDGLATRARVKQAKSGLRQIQIGKEQLSDGIDLEVRVAFFGFQESKELLKAQEETVQQAEESLRIANLRYRNGMITNVELMDAELAFTQAQTNRFNALHDYAVAIARLEKASASKLD